MVEVKWKSKPNDHDYPAAASYLSLHFSSDRTAEIVEELRNAPMTEFKAKDVLRAADIQRLGPENAHVRKNLARIDAGEKLSPILLVRGLPLLIADGYHRVSAVHFHDEDAVIPAKIV